MSSRRRGFAWMIALAAIVGPGAGFAKDRTCFDPKTRAATDICPPDVALTPASAAALEEKLRAETIAAEAEQSARRAKRQLLEKYPDEASLRRLELADLQLVGGKINRAMARLADFTAQRKKLQSEAEFYKGKPLPPALQRAIEGSDAQLQAQTQIFQDQQAEVVAITAKYGEMAARLRDSWPRR